MAGKFSNNSSLLNKWLKNKRNEIDDEFYTRPATARFIIDQALKNGAEKLLLPCDSEDSEFTKYCKELGVTYKNYTDFETALDENDNTWTVVTNPPFSLLARLILPRLFEGGYRFIIVAPVVTIKYSAVRPYVTDVRTCKCPDERFDRPDGSTIHIACQVFTNFADLPKRQAKRVDAGFFEYDEGWIQAETQFPEFPKTEPFRVLMPLTGLYYDLPYHLVKIIYSDVHIDGKQKFSKLLMQHD